MKISIGIVAAVLTGSYGVGRSAEAASTALIQIEQVSAGTYGTWTLVSTDGTARSSTDPGVNAAKHSMSLSEFSPLTLMVTPPPGMTTKISMYRGGDLKSTSSTPQITVTPFPNDSYRFVIQYALTQLGTLGVTSEPSGLRFRVKGPTNRTLSSVTPHTFSNIPAGQYSITVSPTRRCLSPAPHSVIVEPGGRNALNITLTCDVKATEELVRIRPSKRSIVEAVDAREQKPRGERK